MTPIAQPVALLLSSDAELATFLRGVLRHVSPSFALRWAGDSAAPDTAHAKLILADCHRNTVPTLACRLTEIRAKAPDAPIVALLTDAAGIDAALACGADEWIVRWSSRGEFIARIRYCKLRGSGGFTPFKADQTLMLDEGRRAARIGGVSLKLRRAEFKILSHLASNPGRSVNAPELLRAVLDSGGSNGSVRVHIVALRKALADAGYGDLIITDRGRGYRLADSRLNLDLTVLDTI